MSSSEITKAQELRKACQPYRWNIHSSVCILGRIKKNIYIYGVSIYTKCKQPALLAEAIYTNSINQRVIGVVNDRRKSAPVV